MIGQDKFLGTLKQSLMALSFNIFGVFAGAIVAFHLGLFSMAPWIIAIYPGILSARGVIAGLLSGRLSTGLHIGTVRPRFLGNTKSFYLLFKAIVVLTLETSVAVSLVAVVFGAFLWGAKATDLFVTMGVITATMALSLVLISPLTMVVSFISFKRGLDPDIILYPVESTISDVLVTLCYVSVLNVFFLFYSLGSYIIIAVSLILTASALYFFYKNWKEREFVKTLKESFLTLVFVAFIVNVTGSVLGKISEVIGSRREIYTVYPALIDTIGDVGAVVGSTVTTKLALGTLKPSLFAVMNHMNEIIGAWTASIIMFIIYSILSLLMQGTLMLDLFIKFTSLLLITNIFAVCFTIAISYAVSITTFQRGLDPDNFVIPIESSMADSMTTISLLVALALIG
jgi:mgtE-like transporter